MFWLQLMKDRTIVGIPKRTSAYRAPSPGSEYEKLRAAEHHDLPGPGKGTERCR